MPVAGPDQSTPESSDGASGAGGGASPRGRQPGKILLEAIVVALLGIAFAFAANAISPRGLRLNTNYFPTGVRNAAVPATNATPVVAPPDGTNAAATSPVDLLAARLQSLGLLLAGSNQVTQLFRDPRYEQDLIVFVDARNDQLYQEGHIPGAYQFDHYRAEQYLAAVLPVCQAAEQVVVYCTGGDCEDSEFAAIYLRDKGIAPNKLLVYGNGWTEWTALGLPIEIGARKSGQLRNTGK